jgi:hypothetical protein
MIEVYCAFSGHDWTVFKSENINSIKNYLDDRRNAMSRPSHIILVNSDLELYAFTQSILWTPQILIEFNGLLEGGMEQTRKYFQKYLIKIKSTAIPI